MHDHQTIRALLVVLMLTAPPLHANPLLEQGRAAFSAGDTEAAAQAFEQAHAAAPRDAEAAYWLARAELRRGNAQRALDLLGAAVKSRPDAADYQHWYGQAIGANMDRFSTLQKMRHAGRMRDAWQKAVELDPDHLAARRSLMMYYLQAPAIAGGGRDKALGEVEEIRKRDPVQGHRAMGALHSVDGAFDEARGEYEAAVAAAPDDTDLLLEYAFLCQRGEFWDCAFDAFTAYPPDGEHAMMARYQVGRTAVLSGERLDEGAAALERYLEGTPHAQLPSPAWAHVRLGQVYEKQGRRDEARAQFRAALALDPKHDEAGKALADLEKSTQ